MNPIDPNASASRPSHRLLIGIAAFVTAFGWSAASTAASTAAPPSAAAPESAASEPTLSNDPSVLAPQLVERLKKQPDNVSDWQLLARAYIALGRPSDAADAYRRVLALTPKDAQAHADLARAISSANGRKFNAEAESLLKKAIELEPNNVLALSLLGKSALDRGQKALAKQHWEKALAQLDDKHPFAQQLRTAIQIAEAPPPAAAASAAASAASTPRP